MMSFFSEIYNNKLLFYGIIVVIGFVVFSLILMKRIDKEKEENQKVDYEKIDGNKSLFDEVVKEESNAIKNDGKLDLEVMIEKMQRDLDAKASEVVEKFETEQEEKSVISYQELIGENHNNEVKSDIMEALDNLKITSEIEPIMPSTSRELVDDESVIEPVIDEPLRLNQKDEFVNAIKTGDYEEELVEKGKFKSTDFISPIYGVQDIKMQYPTVQNMKEFKQPAHNYNKFELEQTLNMEPLTDEIRRNEDFLKALKEFRKNLE